MEMFYDWEQITITSVLLKVQHTTERNVYPRIRDLKMVLEPGRYPPGSLVTANVDPDPGTVGASVTLIVGKGC